MPIPIQVFKCAVCGARYDHYHEAAACEARPLETFGLEVGKVITFEDESSFGSRYSYCTMSGTVLHVMVLRYRDIHRQACIVQVNNRPYEAMVAMSDTEFGQQLSSACDWKYPLGYAAQLQMEGT